ncbi:MAG: DUF5668 domain-containing protein [Burkholderiaceae bacterium]|nr:DUF5668 domain-containing protein [Burkholderiaceae bacterium]
MKSPVLAIVLVLLGTFFLLNNLGLLDVSLWHLLAVWWPVILIALGLSMFFAPGPGGRK